MKVLADALGPGVLTQTGHLPAPTTQRPYGPPTTPDLPSENRLRKRT